jgi:hypothetical protein
MILARGEQTRRHLAVYGGIVLWRIFQNATVSNLSVAKYNSSGGWRLKEALAVFCASDMSQGWR